MQDLEKQHSNKIKQLQAEFDKKVKNVTDDLEAKRESEIKKLKDQHAKEVFMCQTRFQT